MSTINDGGPIHPCRIPTGGLHANDEPAPTTFHFGMSMRDHFAGLAMQALISATRTTQFDAANLAYEIADAMLRARTNQSTGEPK